MIRARQPKNTGMTLIEIMIVVAILALLLTVLIVYLMPSDDRRCKLEAERLAVFMTAASAEAVMADGAVRVGCAFDKQVCTREYQQLRAAVTDSMWEIDGKAGTHKIGKPVKITVLDLPTGTLESGTGFFGFRGRRASGGVAVLTLNESVWSVIVPAQGDVRIERGRAKLPDAPDVPLLANGMLPDPLQFPPSLGGGDTPNFAGGGGGGFSRSNGAQGSARRNSNNNSGNDTPSDDPEDYEDPEDPDLDAGLPPDQGINPDASFEQPDEQDAALEPDASIHECEASEDCDGNWEICEENKCVVDIGNRSFVLQTIQVNAPPGVAPFFTKYMQDAIDDNDLILGVQIGRSQGTSAGAETPHEAWVVNMKRAGGGRYRLNSQLPSFRYVSTYLESCTYGDICLKLEPEASDQLNIYLKHPQPVDDCGYTKVAVVANFQLEINSGNGEARLVLGGLIQDKAASDITFRKSTLAGLGISGGNTVGLDEIFDQLNVDRDAIYPPDSISGNNAWTFSFEGNSRITTIQGDPESLLNRKPDGCD